MRACILDQRTNVCVNIIELDSFDYFISSDPHHTLASRHDGEIGWILNNDVWLDTVFVQEVEDPSTKARNLRNKYLTITDKYVLPDFPLSDELRSAIIAYRQQLRDLPDQAGFPDNIVWPEQPFDILK